MLQLGGKESDFKELHLQDDYESYENSNFLFFRCITFKECFDLAQK